MLEPSSINRYNLTEHARDEMARRLIKETDVARVLLSPDQIENVRPGRVVYQSRLPMNDPPKTYLLRVFVDIDRDPPEVVTAYRTSKIAKYGRAES